MTKIIGFGIQDLLTSKRSQILAIAEQHGAYNVRVFVSVTLTDVLREKERVARSSYPFLFSL